MTETTFFYLVLGVYVLLALVTFPVLFFVDAPYGRFGGKTWQGPTIDNRLGWILMEAPSPIIVGLCFVAGPYNHGLVMWLFVLMWEAHYVHRAFIFPLTLRGRNKRMPVMVAGLALCFNIANGYLNGRYVFNFSGGYADQWLLDWRFIIGTILFIAGYFINRHSDMLLRRLRVAGESGYKIPQGGLHRWISSPNYFGEIVEWGGFALATWSITGLAFFIWTLANLVPRAHANQRWYLAHFLDYPPRRKALLPFLW